MSIPQLNPSLLHSIDEQFPGFLNWYTLWMTFMQTQFDTKGDITLLTAGKGIELVSSNGTKYLATVDNTGAWDINPG